MKQVLMLVCLCSLAACAPQPKTAVDIQTEKVVAVERETATKVDHLQARAQEYWDHCSYRAAYDTAAREECQAVWNSR